jgi:hypothetical protein
MYNVCVWLRDPASSNLKEGNLRSEARWERQVLEACLQSPLIQNVYTAGCVWKDGSLVSTKYKGQINKESAKNSILLIQDWNFDRVTAYNYKGVIVNIFAGPWLNEIGEVSKAAARYGDRLVFTIGFPILYKNLSAISHLEKFLPKRNILSLPVPAIPASFYENRFNNKTLLWTWRLISVSALASNPGLLWAFSKLRTDPSLTLSVLTGWKPSEVTDVIDGVAVKIKEPLTEYLWAKPELSEYKDLKNRVIIEDGIGWDQALKKYSQSKLLVVHGKYFGGPPLEAAMHGVPFIGTSLKEGALAECPEYLYTGNTKEAYEMLDRLLIDEDFYVKTAKAYHDYAINLFSYTAFCNNLGVIFNSRGM